MKNQRFNARVNAALQLSFIADSVAMPVHWFYNPLDIDNAFPGGFTRFEPKNRS